MAAETPRGRFVWYDLVTSDPDAAQRFYKEVIGWGTQPFEGSPEPYTMWMVGENPIGGVMRLSEQAAAASVPPHWMGYISTPDIEATSKQAQKLGAKVIVPPTPIPEVGHFAIYTDPQGASFATFQPGGEAPGHAGPPQPGQFSWHELATTDYKAAFAFYSELFGWTTTATHDMGPLGIYHMFGTGDTALGGMFNKTAEIPGPPSWLYYITVDEINGAADRVRNAGGGIVNGPMEVPGGDWIAQCMDPQGAMFAVHVPVHAPAAVK